MSSIEAEIKDRAKSALEKIIDRAERIKEKELAIARKKKEEIVIKGREDEDKKINVRRNSLNAQLKLEYRLKKDNFKDELCSELLSEAKKALGGLDDNAILDSLKRLIREGVVDLGLNRALVRVNNRCAVLLKEHYNEAVDFIKEKAAGFEGMNIDSSLDDDGVIVASVDTGEFFDNTFKRRLERFEEELREKILEGLG